MKKLKVKKYDFKHYEAYCFMNGLKFGRLTSLLKYQSYIKALEYGLFFIDWINRFFLLFKYLCYIIIYYYTILLLNTYITILYI